MTQPIGMWGKETKHFHDLTPEYVFGALIGFGPRLTGRIMALNSLENRVYDIELASAIDTQKGFSPNNIIVKFYRPNRWSKDQIQEEHNFLNTLAEFEVPVAAPIEFNGQTIHLHQETQLYFAIFPKVLGRLKDEFNKEELEQAGRLIGRIHNIGSMSSFKYRPQINPENFVLSSKNTLSEIQFLDSNAFKNYILLLEQVYPLLAPKFNNLQIQRLHGDFHRGNIVWTSAGPVAVDFDDCLTGPVEQDLWLLNPGTDEYSRSDREYFLTAYKDMTRKDHLQLNLTEVFRTMRMIHFNAWIAKRWDDHSFKKIFPQFISSNYWEEQLIDLRMQLSLIQESSYY